MATSLVLPRLIKISAGVRVQLKNKAIPDGIFNSVSPDPTTAHFNALRRALDNGTFDCPVEHQVLPQIIRATPRMKTLVVFTRKFGIESETGSGRN